MSAVVDKGIYRDGCSREWVAQRMLELGHEPAAAAAAAKVLVEALGAAGTVQGGAAALGRAVGEFAKTGIPPSPTATRRPSTIAVDMFDAVWTEIEPRNAALAHFGRALYGIAAAVVDSRVAEAAPTIVDTVRETLGLNRAKTQRIAAALATSLEGGEIAPIDAHATRLRRAYDDLRSQGVFGQGDMRGSFYGALARGRRLRAGNGDPANVCLEERPGAETAETLLKAGSVERKAPIRGAFPLYCLLERDRPVIPSFFTRGDELRAVDISYKELPAEVLVTPDGLVNAGEQVTENWQTDLESRFAGVRFLYQVPREPDLALYVFKLFEDDRIGGSFGAVINRLIQALEDNRDRIAAGAAEAAKAAAGRLVPGVEALAGDAVGNVIKGVVSFLIELITDNLGGTEDAFETLTLAHLTRPEGGTFSSLAAIYLDGERQPITVVERDPGSPLGAKFLGPETFVTTDATGLSGRQQGQLRKWFGASAPPGQLQAPLAALANAFARTRTSVMVWQNDYHAIVNIKLRDRDGDVQADYVVCVRAEIIPATREQLRDLLRAT